MGRRMARFDATEVARRIAERYGAGWGRDYKPWLSFLDFSSRGMTTRLHSPKLDRTVLLFSNVERNAFLISEYLRTFVDYHEQGPIPTELSLDIARDLGLRHPTYFGNRVPVVLTYDGLLYTSNSRPKLIDCKHSRSKETARDLEDYAFRHEFARRMDYDILRITDQSYTRDRIQNLQWMRMAVAGLGEYPVSRSETDLWSTKLFLHLEKAIGRGECQPVRSIVKEFCAANGQLSGMGLVWLRQLLWNRHLDFNLDLHHEWLLAGPVSTLKVGPQLRLAEPETA